MKLYSEAHSMWKPFPAFIVSINFQPIQILRLCSDISLRNKKDNLCTPNLETGPIFVVSFMNLSAFYFYVFSHAVLATDLTTYILGYV